MRNLLIGKDICQIFGQRMMVGYIPDPFGHLSQLPQILNGFTWIRLSLAWRARRLAHVAQLAISRWK